jgi:predicted permease
MNNFVFALNIIFPIFILLAIGYLVSHIGWMSKKSLKNLNGFIFRLLLPLMLFINIYNMDKAAVVSNEAIKTIAAIYLTLICIASIMALILNRTTDLKNSQKGVIIQAWFRGNTIIYGLPVVLSIYGQSSLDKVNLVIISIVPLINVLAVIVLQLYRGKSLNFLAMLLSIIKNPLIIGTALGFAFFYLNIKIPAIILKPITDLSKTATPMAFIVLGGTLELSKIGKNLNLIIFSCIGRLIVTPLIALLVLLAFGVEGVYLGTAVSCLAAPSAVGSFTMASEMDGDADLASLIVVISTVVSVVSIFFWVLVLKTLNLL